jgi:periplasmic copper chaperone A
MKIRFLLAALLLHVAAFAATAQDVVVRDAWIRAAPPNAPVLAGYMTLENRSDRSKSLVGASSPAFGSATVHRTAQVNGVARMHHVPSIDIGANGKFVFQPNGYHLMLMEPKRPLHAGDRVRIDLEFSDGSKASALFPVREQAEQLPSHASH